MGFCDLHMFNLALLGKNGWRFLTNPTSLCARVMKGRYFPDTDFLHATAPKAASATWRAIIAGREALLAGIVQRVGDGTSINPWTDKWIPTTLTRAPLFKPSGTNITQVSEFIDTENWTWNQDLVRHTFITPEAEAILNIPLRRGGGEDTLAWAHERSGIYTDKSAYRALVIQKEHQAREERQVTESLVSKQQLWKSLWSLKVVPKVRVF